MFGYELLIDTCLALTRSEFIRKVYRKGGVQDGGCGAGGNEGVSPGGQRG